MFRSDSRLHNCKSVEAFGAFCKDWDINGTSRTFIFFKNTSRKKSQFNSCIPTPSPVSDDTQHSIDDAFPKTCQPSLGTSTVPKKQTAISIFATAVDLTVSTDRSNTTLPAGRLLRERRANLNLVDLSYGAVMKLFSNRFWHLE